LLVRENFIKKDFISNQILPNDLLSTNDYNISKNLTSPKEFIKRDFDDETVIKKD